MMTRGFSNDSYFEALRLTLEINGGVIYLKESQQANRNGIKVLQQQNI